MEAFHHTISKRWRCKLFIGNCCAMSLRFRLPISRLKRREPRAKTGNLNVGEVSYARTRGLAIEVSYCWKLVIDMTTSLLVKLQALELQRIQDEYACVVYAMLCIRFCVVEHETLNLYNPYIQYPFISLHCFGAEWEETPSCRNLSCGFCP